MYLSNILQVLLATILVSVKAQCQSGDNFKNIYRHNVAEKSNEMTTRGYLLSREARRSVEQILQQMPTGWPQFGIPPLAPYTNENISMHVANELINFQSKLKPLEISGLNKMQIKQLNVGAMFKKVTYDFMFPKITITGKFDTSVKLPFISAIASSLSLKGNGDLDLGLEHVRLSGAFKYKLPLFMGSSELYDFKLNLNLASVQSHLKGTINALPISKQLNGLIANYILKMFNGNGGFWSAMLEQTLLPRVNELLHDRTLWNLFMWSMATKEREGLESKDMPTLHSHGLNQKIEKQTTALQLK